MTGNWGCVCGMWPHRSLLAPPSRPPLSGPHGGAEDANGASWVYVRELTPTTAAVNARITL